MYHPSDNFQEGGGGGEVEHLAFILCIINGEMSGERLSKPVARAIVPIDPMCPAGPGARPNR